MIAVAPIFYYILFLILFSWFIYIVVVAPKTSMDGMSLAYSLQIEPNQEKTNTKHTNIYIWKFNVNHKLNLTTKD